MAQEPGERRPRGAGDLARSELRLSRDHMAQALQKNIRGNAEQWNRIEEADGERDVSLNQLLIEFAIDVLDRREWPRTEADIERAGASLFAAQIVARDLMANSRKQGGSGDP